ncbi:MAG TPA: hypothetical protein VHS27_07420 [Gaiellales bacterium]|nr:hypothetical protein [Gaiellales bacterium]
MNASKLPCGRMGLCANRGYGPRGGVAVARAAAFAGPFQAAAHLAGAPCCAGGEGELGDGAALPPTTLQGHGRAGA